MKRFKIKKWANRHLYSKLSAKGRGSLNIVLCDRNYAHRLSQEHPRVLTIYLGFMSCDGTSYITEMLYVSYVFANCTFTISPANESIYLVSPLFPPSVAVYQNDCNLHIIGT